VGISPVGGFTGTTILYVPSYDSVNPTTASTWTETNATNANNPAWTWATIPCLTGSDTPTTNNRNKNDLYDQNAQYPDKKGDICRYIGDTSSDPALKDYRMPTSYEFDYDKKGTGEWSSGGQLLNWALYNLANWGTVTSTSDTDGTSTLIQWGGQQFDDATFPASGFRASNGALSNVGKMCLYWSGSASNANSSAYYLEFGDTGAVYLASVTSRNNGFPIRCVKI
jgi:hypothetical protein